MKFKLLKAPFILLSFAVILCTALVSPGVPVQASTGWGQYLTRSFLEDGRQIDEVAFPGKPPDEPMEAVDLPDVMEQGSLMVLSGVPVFDWCYGCSATSAAMMAGYYDRNGYSLVYTGPAASGVCPLDNSIWGEPEDPQVSGECPISASNSGVDGRSARGHVDDYWQNYLNAGPDPYVGEWTQHSADSLGDFMGTNQSAFSNVDGSTSFYFYSNGTPLYDYTGSEPASRDGAHGIKLYFQYRGYSLQANGNYSQYILGQAPNNPSAGFTYAQFRAEIDAGRPVLIQLTGHTMLGIGYDTTGSKIYVHDTWDHSAHLMTWGGTYSGMQHKAVTVVKLNSAPSPATITLTTPNSGENWLAGTSHDITWSSSNLTGNVNLQLSRDGGSNWTNILSNTPNDGSQSWVVSSPATTQARVKVVSTSDGNIYDASNSNFIISSPPPPTTTTSTTTTPTTTTPTTSTTTTTPPVTTGTSLALTSPNGGEAWVRGQMYPVTWSSDILGNVRIDLYKGSSLVKIISSSTPASAGMRAWTIPTTQALGTDYRIRVMSLSNSAIKDLSEGVFSIVGTPPPSTTTTSTTTSTVPTTTTSTTTTTTSTTTTTTSTVPTTSTAPTTTSSVPPQGNGLHIKSISMSLMPLSTFVKGVAAITVVNENGTPVSGARVYGVWSGASSDSDNGLTTVAGSVNLSSNFIRSSPGLSFTFTVTNIVLSGYSYDSGANAEGSGTITV